MENAGHICCSRNSSVDRNVKKQIPFSRLDSFSCESSVMDLWRQSGAIQILLLLFKIWNKISEENIFQAQTLIAKLCRGSRGQMAHPGIILVWYFANGQVFLRHCMLLPCILCVISFWRLWDAGDLSKSLGKFRLKCKGTEDRVSVCLTEKLPGVCMHTPVQAQGNDHAVIMPYNRRFVI